MEISTEPVPEEPGIVWAPAWGDALKNHDLLRVTKLGGTTRVISLRRFSKPPRGPDDTASWYYGVIVETPDGTPYHLFVQPEEPIFIGVETPTDTGYLEEKPGSDE